jgi:hypothetical protein
MKKEVTTVLLVLLGIGCRADPGASSYPDLGQGGASGGGGAGGGGPLGPVSLPFAVDSRYSPSGYMGDGESGGVADEAACPARAGEEKGNCHRFTLTKKDVGWGGIFWQYPDGNWGVLPGLDIPAGATRISFWAWGEKGGETVSFLVGIADADGFGIDSGPITLTKEPKQYFLSLRNATYTDVVGGFGWSAGGMAAPVVFYVDDIQWQDVEVPVEPVYGCMDSDAANYNAAANMENGSCQYPVTFQVDMTGVTLAAGEIVYLQSVINGWCGVCNPMSDQDGDGVWTLALPVAAGTYEYKYTTNGWDGQQETVPPECDVNPAGEFANRGVTVGTAPLTIPLHRFGSCD